MTSTAIDFFCGAGGFSTGATQAGVTVAACANHWEQAVAIHELNHPETKHFCQDLQIADLTLFPAHDLFLGSPACQGHSRARGKERPHHDLMRATAWVVVNSLEIHRPQSFIIENVPEFLSWDLFEPWTDCLKRLGYKLTTQVLNAADFGVPQARLRAFVVGDLSAPITIENPQMPHVAARTIIDWESGDWRPIDNTLRARQGLRLLADPTLKRIANGHRQLGDEFLLAYYGAETGGRSLDKPIGTITTTDRFAVVKGGRMRMLSIDEYRRAMGFPDNYILPSGKEAALKMLGNAVPPGLARGVIHQVLATRSAALLAA